MGWGVDPCFLVPDESRVRSMVLVCRQQLSLRSSVQSRSAFTDVGGTGSGLGRPLPPPSTALHLWAQGSSLIPQAGSDLGLELWPNRRKQEGAIVREWCNGL